MSLFLKMACPHCARHLEFERASLGEIILCPDCGLSVVLAVSGVQRPAGPKKPALPEGNPMDLLATLLVIGGIIGLVYFAAFFDTSVAVPGGGVIGVARVNNIGLQQDRLIGIVVSCVALVLGAVFALIPRRR